MAENKVKSIAVLTSGGDAPGMNAAIRAVVRSGLSAGYRVLGIKRGYNGLIHGDIVEMNLRSVSDIIHRGGTMLYTARCPEFNSEEGLQKAKLVCQDFGLDSVVVIGGDGSFRGALDLSERGIPCIGIPGTIDNDIASSDYTIGYDTAMNTAMDMIDKIRDTSQSHDRCSVIEVMGRRAGYIALNTGIACGATSILVAEKEYDIDRDIIEQMKKTQKTGKKHFIVLVSEGIGHVDEIAKEIEAKTGVESRATVLGHVQRGGSPTLRDRVTASLMGNYAVELIRKDIGNRVVVMKNDHIIDYSIKEALSMKKSIDENQLQIAHEISI